MSPSEERDPRGRMLDKASTKSRFCAKCNDAVQTSGELCPYCGSATVPDIRARSSIIEQKTEAPRISKITSGVNESFVYSHLIIGGVGAIGTFLPYGSIPSMSSSASKSFSGWQWVGKLSEAGMFSAGPWAIFLLSLLVVLNGGLHLMSWGNDNPSLTKQSQGTISIILGLGITIMGIVTVTTINRGANMADIETTASFGAYFAVLVGIATIGAGMLCFLDPKFYRREDMTSEPINSAVVELRDTDGLSGIISTPSKFCTNCGARHPELQKFCGQCGSQIKS